MQWFVFLCSHGDGWAWVPPLGGITGAVLGSFLYQLIVGNHLLDDENEFMRHRNSRTRLEKDPVTLKALTPSNTSVVSINTVSTFVEQGHINAYDNPMS